MDYIHYYSSLGDRSYIRLEEIYKRYSEFPLKAVLAAISGGKYVKERVIKNGDANFTDEEFERGIEALEFIKNIRDNVKVQIIAPGIFFFLTLKVYYLEGVNRDKLFDSIVSKYGTENYGNSDQCAAALEHWYNYKSKTYRYISNEILPRR